MQPMRVLCLLVVAAPFIASGEQVPDGTRIVVPYRGIWFWIDDTDLDSKHSLAFLLTLFSLSEGTASGSSPMLTIN